jgi:hypothetical protein
MPSRLFWEFLTGTLYVAILYVLVRPGSAGAAAVKTLGDGLTVIVKTATGTTPSTS